MPNSSIELKNESAASAKAVGRPLILVADDDADTRLMLRTMLQILGYQVIESPDGEATVQMAASARPDLILMDGSLPRVDGLTATRQIRMFNQTPIVFISGHADASFLMRARRAGCDEYLVKPIDFDQLEKVIRKYTGWRGQASQGQAGL